MVRGEQSSPASHASPTWSRSHVRRAGDVRRACGTPGRAPKARWSR